MPNPAERFFEKERANRVKEAGLSRKKAKALFKGRPPEPRGLIVQYTAFLLRLEKAINDEIREQLKPLTAEILQIRQDGITDITTAVFRSIRNTIDRFLDPIRIKFGVSKQGDDITQFNYKKYDKAFFNLLGLNDLPVNIETEVLASWVEENLRLIKGINDEKVKSLEALMYRSARDGSRPKELIGAIAKIFKTDKNRATLIARDQTLKLNGQLDRLKQENAGVTHYIWRTSRDLKVRKKHQVREGKRYAWDLRSPEAPPDKLHPGQDVNCRCNAQPDIDGLLVKLEKT